MIRSFANKIIFIALLAVLISCGGNSVHFSIAQYSDSFLQGEGSTFNSNKVDILWIIDNSSSMTPLQNNLADNFSQVTNIFASQGYDYQMAVTTTDAYLGDTSLTNYNPQYASYSRYRDGLGSNHSGFFILTPTTPNIDKVFVTNATQGGGGAGDERAFSSMRAALENPQNPTLNRSGAFFSVIILSDEDDFSGNTRPLFAGNNQDYLAPTLDPIQTYISYLDNRSATFGASRRFNINSIVVTTADCLAKLKNQGNVSSIIGKRYIEIANLTDGVVADICDASFAQSLKDIAKKIIILNSQFYLSKTPQIETIKIFINNQPIYKDDINGWSYNTKTNSILFYGSSIPRPGSIIKVTYSPH